MAGMRRPLQFVAAAGGWGGLCDCWLRFSRSRIHRIFTRRIVARIRFYLRGNDSYLLGSPPCVNRIIMP